MSFMDVFAPLSEEVSVLADAVSVCLGRGPVHQDIGRYQSGDCEYNQVCANFNAMPRAIRLDIRENALEIARSRLPYFRQIASGAAE
jgi:hypothetical protein